VSPSAKPKCAVQLRNVYGNRRIYPCNTSARLFCALAGTKTLSEAHLTHIRELGYEIEWIPESIPVKEGNHEGT